MRGVIALFVRSLRQDARSLITHIARGGAVLMMVVIVYSMLSVDRLAVSPGLSVFQAVLWINFFFISMAAIGYFATSITEEKAENTLGLLRMAGISPLALLFGKSVTRLWMALVLIAIQFPFALLAITLGGVNLRQVAATYISLGAYTFFLSGMATLCSVASRKSLRAVVYMTVLSGVLLMLPSLMDSVVDVAGLQLASPWTERVEAATDWVRNVSVISRLQSVMAVAYDDPLIERHFIASVVGGLLFYLVAWMLFDFFTNRHSDNSPGTLGRNLKKKLGLTAGRTWPMAVVWKDFNFVAGGFHGWIMRFIILVAGTTLFCLADWYYFPQMFDAEDAGWILFNVTIILTIIELSVQSVRFLTEEHSAKTLPLLAMLPWSHVSTLLSKYAGALMAMLPYLFGFVTAVTLHPEMVGDFLVDITDHATDFFAFTWLVTAFGVFLSLNTFLGSYAKWGAIPLSFAAIVVFNMCCLVPSIDTGRDAAGAVFFVLSWIHVGVIVGLQFGISSRFLRLQGS